MEVLVTRQVVEAISAGVRDGQRDSLEYGGSLLAHESRARTLVAYALPTGPSADQSATRLRTDADYQNTAMARVLRRFPALTYVGDWHVHPMWLPQLSATDRRTAARILAEEAGHKEHLVLLLGTARPAGEVHVLGFIARPGRGAEAAVEARSVRVVDDAGPEVLAVLGQELPPLGAVLPTRASPQVAHRGRPPRSEVKAPQTALKAIAWPLHLLERALHALSYQPLLSQPLVTPASRPRRGSRRSPMKETKIYKLRTHPGETAPCRSGVVVISPDLLDRLRALEPGGAPLYGRATGDARTVVHGLEARDDLRRVGWAWAREEEVDRDVLSGGEVSVIAEAPARAYRDTQPLEMVVLDGQLYRDRVRALPGVDELRGKRVLLVGLGSVGSDLGARLARLGVRVVGCDPDLLAVENLIRWGILVEMDEHVGRPKADVWVERLRATVPAVGVDARTLDVVREGAAFEALVRSERPDLLICATDTADSRRVVNAAAARHGVKALYVALADGAASVRIEIVEDASLGPCHLCAEHGEGIVPAGFGGTRRSRTPYATESKPSQAAVAALPVDVGIGAAIAARVALLLLAGADAGAWFVNGEQRGNVMFMALQPNTWVFEEPWTRLVYQVERDPCCPVCSDSDEEVNHDD